MRRQIKKLHGQVSRMAFTTTPQPKERTTPHEQHHKTNARKDWISHTGAGPISPLLNCQRPRPAVSPPAPLPAARLLVSDQDDPQPAGRCRIRESRKGGQMAIFSLGENRRKRTPKLRESQAPRAAGFKEIPLNWPDSEGLAFSCSNLGLARQGSFWILLGQIAAKAVREVVAGCCSSLAPHLDAWPSWILCRLLSVIAPSPDTEIVAICGTTLGRGRQRSCCGLLR